MKIKLMDLADKLSEKRDSGDKREFFDFMVEEWPSLLPVFRKLNITNNMIDTTIISLMLEHELIDVRSTGRKLFEAA